MGKVSYLGENEDCCRNENHFTPHGWTKYIYLNDGLAADHLVADDIINIFYQNISSGDAITLHSIICLSGFCLMLYHII